MSRYEMNSGKPVAVTVKPKVREKSLNERIRAMIRSEQLSAAADAAGFETFEEANDFDIPDDDTLDMFGNTPYEEHFDPPPPAEDTFFEKLSETLVKALRGPEATDTPADPETAAQPPQNDVQRPIPEEFKSLTPKSSADEALAALAAYRQRMQLSPERD